MIEKERTAGKRILDCINPYAWVMAARNKAFDCNILKSRSFTLPTICIGNITVGGTGKTPHTEYIVKLLCTEFKTAVLSRGYGRSSKGYVLADEKTPMRQIGDEPFQIKNKFSSIDVAVCEKRATGIERLLENRPGTEAILLDDAYQHRYVKAGLNILLIDSNRPLWQDCVLPFGRMRERLSGIERADIVIITKCSSLGKEQEQWCRNYIRSKKDIPVFFSAMRYGKLYPLFADACNSRRETGTGTGVLLVTGIAKPEPMKKEIERTGAKVTLKQFADHHNFTAADIESIAAQYNAMAEEEKIIITTEKDATRLLQREGLPAIIKENIYALPIEVEILCGEENMFNKKIIDYVTENSRNS